MQDQASVEHADLCVIGAGMAGLAAAHAAARRGARVLVLEAGGRAGGRVRTVHPRWAAGAPVECGPEFVDANHRLLREACEQAGVTLQRVSGTFHLFRDGVVAPDDVHPARDRAEDRLSAAYWGHVHELARGIADPDRPNDHPAAGVLDAEPVQALMARLATEVDAGPRAHLQLARFVQGVLGAEPEDVSTLFVAQQAAIEGGGSSARVVEGLGTVAAHLARALPAPSAVRVAARASRLEPHADGVRVHTTHGRVIDARGAVLAVPLHALAGIDPNGVLDPAWHAAARDLRYGSLVKATVATDATIPGWAVASELPTGLVWQSRPGLATTYTGGARADLLAAMAPHEVVAQAAADVATITARPVAPVGGTWRWTPASRRGGCYVVFGAGQVAAHWDVLRARRGPFALAGEHCGAFTGYVEGAMQAGARAAAQLLDR